VASIRAVRGIGHPCKRSRSLTLDGKNRPTNTAGVDGFQGLPSDPFSDSWCAVAHGRRAWKRPLSPHASGAMTRFLQASRRKRWSRFSRSMRGPRPRHGAIGPSSRSWLASGYEPMQSSLEAETLSTGTRLLSSSARAKRITSAFSLGCKTSGHPGRRLAAGDVRPPPVERSSAIARRPSGHFPLPRRSVPWRPAPLGRRG
jgi:hypothetical protein